MFYYDFVTNTNEVERLHEESVDGENCSWESCDGFCVNLDDYQFPDDVAKVIQTDSELEHISLTHYYVWENDEYGKQMIEDRLFLFIDDEPVAVWLWKEEDFKGEKQNQKLLNIK